MESGAVVKTPGAEGLVESMSENVLVAENCGDVLLYAIHRHPVPLLGVQAIEVVLDSHNSPVVR